jgi:MFS family permease
VAIGTFMLLLEITTVNVALPDIEGQLHASISDLQWVLDAYALSLAALMLTAGALADLLGRRVVLATGIAIFTVGSLLCGVAQSPLFLSLARAGQGVGGAVMFATSLALLADAFRGPIAGSRLACSGRSPGSPSRSARCSAERSRADCRGAGFSSSTSRSASARSR